MQLIDRAGTFRGNPTEWGVSTTRNGFPQLVVKFLATEYFDESGELGDEPNAWVNWEQYQMEITGFLVLFGADDKPCLNYEQVQKAFNWDGASFGALDAADLSNAVIQFRVEEDTFEGTTRLKVVWIDTHDADPGRSIKKLDPKSLKDLDSKFKAAMGATPTPKKATAPTAPPKASTLPKTATQEAEDPTPADGADDSSATAAPPAEEPSGTTPPPVKKKRGRPPGSKNKKSEEPAGDGGLPTECTQTEGWEKVLELKDESVTEDTVAEVWLEVSNQIVQEEQSEDDITPIQWAQIRDGVFNKIPHSKF